VIGSRDIQLKTGWKEYDMTADDISAAVEWLEAIERNIKALKTNKESVKTVAKKLNAEKQKLEKQISELGVEMSQIRVASEEEHTNTQILQDIIRFTDNHLDNLKLEYEQLLKSQKKLWQRLEDRDNRIAELIADINACSEMNFTEVVDDAEKDDRSDQETVKRLKQRWETDKGLLKRAETEAAEKTDELAENSMKISVARRKVTLVEKKLRHMTNTLIADPDTLLSMNEAN
jgi:chromosome segregation ATPase